MTRTKMRTQANSRKQSGVALLEALISILLFSIGILALLGLQSFAIRSTGDAKDRAEASYLANQIIGRMWSDTNGIGNLSAYAHREGGAACDWKGTDSESPAVEEWLGQVASSLPGAASTAQQIQVNNLTNLVTVTICWRTPTMPAGTWHNHVTVAQVRANVS